MYNDNMATQQPRPRIIVDTDPAFYKAVKQAALDQNTTVRKIVLGCVSTCLSIPLPPEKPSRPAPAPSEEE